MVNGTSPMSSPKLMKQAIKNVVNPTMTRMEAWEASKEAGVEISWEMFKRVAGHIGLSFRK